MASQFKESILSTFSVSEKDKDKNVFNKLSQLKKYLQKELNKSTITVAEADASLLAGALLLNDTDLVKEHARSVQDINIQLWGDSVNPLASWICQYSMLPPVRNMNKFIEGNTRSLTSFVYLLYSVYIFQ